MPETPIRRRPWGAGENPRPLFRDEWLVANGLGGYASGTLAMVPTRRYHALLISALAGHLGRTVMLTHVQERLDTGVGKQELSGYLVGDNPHAAPPPGSEYLEEYRQELGVPIWRYRVGDFVLERSIVMPHSQNTVYVLYRLIAGSGEAKLQVWPAVNFRSHDALVTSPLHEPFTLTTVEKRHELCPAADFPPVRFMVLGSDHAFTAEGKRLEGIRFPMEKERGYPSEGVLWTPGFFTVKLSPGEEAAFVASTEDWDVVRALTPADVVEATNQRRRRLIRTANAAMHRGPAAELPLAADQFVIRPMGRKAEAAYVHALGDEVRTVIAGYPWFTDWGRDTMISLEGLTLWTGRPWDAGYILRTFAHYIRDGLIPNLFPEGQTGGLYNTADATLWYFHALQRYLQVTNDQATLAYLLPRFKDILQHHFRGTRFGIGVDAEDGLLTQGAEGYQLTWMDAKVDDWVVTPRRGKAVEINALWYNALRLAEPWFREGDEAFADELVKRAEQCRTSFNRRFWYADGGYLYDVVDGPDGNDAKLRPNQLFALSLDNPVLDEERWAVVLEAVRKSLLTPFGLRTLAPDDPDFHRTYFGDRRARDAAYHQGTVWPWLIGPFVDAWLRVYPERTTEAREFLGGLLAALDEDGIGTVSEIYDATPPYEPRGCIAQAWSVAELIRAWGKTAVSASPPP